MQNLTVADAPLLSTRPGRERTHTVSLGANGLFASSAGLLWCDGSALYHGDSIVCTVADSPKRFAELGGVVCVWPDKLYYRPETRLYGGMEQSWTGAATFADGSYQGETARANTLRAAAGSFSAFQARDAVEISGCAQTANNGSFIIREISDDGGTLTFYEDTFTLGDDGAALAETAVTVARRVPDLDAVCAWGNRLWGCAGDTVYCTRLGDPFNWYWYDTDDDGPLSTAAWSVDTGSPGDFTACAAYRGCVLFAKPDALYKLYGTKPENFQLVLSSRAGVEADSGASLAVAGDTLYYLSASGVYATAGGTPTRVGDCLGRALTGGVAGTDGVRYYLSAKDADGAAHLFVYDTRTALWSREDAFAASGFAWYAGALYAADGSGVWRFGAGEDAALESSLETGDFYSASPDSKRLLALLLRLEIAAGASVAVSLQYDSDGDWRAVKTLAPAARASFTLPLVPRRCDHFRLKLEGVGAWRLLGVARRELAY